MSRAPHLKHELEVEVKPSLGLINYSVVLDIFYFECLKTTARCLSASELVNLTLSSPLTTRSLESHKDLNNNQTVVARLSPARVTEGFPISFRFLLLTTLFAYI